MSQVKAALKIQRIETLEKLSEAFQFGLTKLYQDVFANPPEYQHWTDSEVEQMFTTYQHTGNVYLAYHQEKIVGFGAIVPFMLAKIYGNQATDKENQPCCLNEAYFTTTLNINLHTAYYVADLGVEPAHQRYGIGTALMQVLLASVPSGLPILIRVSSLRVAAIALYQKLGFQPMELYQSATYKQTDGTILRASKMLMLKATPA